MDDFKRKKGMTKKDQLMKRFFEGDELTNAQLGEMLSIGAIHLKDPKGDGKISLCGLRHVGIGLAHDVMLCKRCIKIRDKRGMEKEHPFMLRGVKK
jgi:hypothetical protein